MRTHKKCMNGDVFSLSFPFGHIFFSLPHLSCSIYLSFLSSLFLLSTSNLIFFFFHTFLFFPSSLLSFSLSSLWSYLSFFLSSYQSSGLFLTFLTDLLSLCPISDLSYWPSLSLSYFRPFLLTFSLYQPHRSIKSPHVFLFSSQLGWISIWR